MELISFLIAVFCSPFKAVARIGDAIFGAPTAVHAAGHLRLVDSIMCSMVLLPASAHNTTRLSKFVDMSGYSFVEFHILIGATDDKIDAKLQESINADGSSATDVTGGAIVQIATTGDNVLVSISAPRQALTKRYVGVLVTIDATGAAALTSAEAFRWGKQGMLPETQQAAGANAYATSQTITATG